MKNLIKMITAIFILNVTLFAGVTPAWNKLNNRTSTIYGTYYLNGINLFFHQKGFNYHFKRSYENGNKRILLSEDLAIPESVNKYWSVVFGGQYKLSLMHINAPLKVKVEKTLGDVEFSWVKFWRYTREHTKNRKEFTTLADTFITGLYFTKSGFTKKKNWQLNGDKELNKYSQEMFNLGYVIHEQGFVKGKPSKGNIMANVFLLKTILLNSDNLDSLKNPDVINLINNVVNNRYGKALKILKSSKYFHSTYAKSMFLLKRMDKLYITPNR